MAAVTKTEFGTYRVRYRDMSGRQRGRTFKRHAAAVRFAREVEVSKDRGEYTDPNDAKIDVADWLEQWERTRLHVRRSTRARDASLIKNHLAEAFKNQTLGSVTPNDGAWCWAPSSTRPASGTSAQSCIRAGAAESPAARRTGGRPGRAWRVDPRPWCS